MPLLDPFDIVISGLDWGILGSIITGISQSFTALLPGELDGNDPVASFDDTEEVLRFNQAIWTNCAGLLCAQLVVDIRAEHPTTVPEPASLVLLGLGLAGLGYRRKNS